METTITLEREIVFAAYKSADPGNKRFLMNLVRGKISLSDSLTEWVTSFQEVCDVMGKDLEDYHVPFDATADQRNDMAHKRLKLIFRCFNGDWIADYGNKNQEKWVVWMKYTPGSGFALCDVSYGYALTFVGAGLFFLDKEDARYFFETWIEDFRNYIKK